MSGGSLAATDRVKLAKILALLGSPIPGERDAAALTAHRIVQQTGLSWAQVLRPPAVEKQLPEMGTWRETVTRCLERSGSLRPWEAGFLRDLPGFRRLSVKQRYILKEIAARVLGEEAP